MLKLNPLSLNKATPARLLRETAAIVCVSLLACLAACDRKGASGPVDGDRTEVSAPSRQPLKDHRPPNPEAVPTLKAEVDPLQMDLVARRHRRGMDAEAVPLDSFSPSRVGELCAAFRDPATSGERRAEILLELQSIASPEVVALAKEAASSDDPTLRALAIELLGTIPGENFSEVARLSLIHI